MTLGAGEVLRNLLVPAGQPRTTGGKRLTIDGLWALEFWMGAQSNGPADSLSFTARRNGENDVVMAVADPRLVAPSPGVPLCSAESGPRSGAHGVCTTSTWKLTPGGGVNPRNVPVS